MYPFDFLIGQCFFSPHLDIRTIHIVLFASSTYIMSHLCMLFLSLLAFISVSNGLHVLMISSGAAGHVIPMFELAKAMKDHHVTFITETYAQSYINFTSYPNLSSFDLIYSNDSRDALMDEKKSEKEILEYATNHSLFDG